MDLNSSLQQPTLLNNHNFIGGIWQSSESKKTYPVINPANEEIITHVANSNANDANLAAKSASQAFALWQHTPHRVRATLLEKWHDLIIENINDLALIISTEQGKPMAEAKAEVNYGASYIKWFSQQVMQIRGDILPTTVSDKLQTVEKRPVGVVAVITPWNFPFAMLTRKIAPAIAAGCSVVIKPAEDTPLTALALTKLAEMANFPKGLFNMITADREQAAIAVGAWLDDPIVKKLTFTGSTKVGKYLAERSAYTLKKLSLELGGNAPFIVFDTADLDAAVDGLIAAKLRNGGQTCVCPNRIYVQDSVYEEFTRKLVSQIATLKVGPATEPDSKIGPMINNKAINKITQHVKDAVEKGGNLRCGNLDPIQQLYFAPTVITEANNDMLLFGEETFGPVLALFRFTDEEEAVEQANNTPYGLAAYFYSNHHHQIHRVKNSLNAGVIGVNEGAIASELAPFGGVNASGYGREGSHYGLDDFLQMTYVCEGNL